MNTVTTRTHVHPKLIDALQKTGFYNITCTIEVRDPEASRTPSGGVDKVSQWVPVVGMSDLPARRVIPGSAILGRNEPRFPWGQIEVDEFVIQLYGYHPTIEASNMRANLSTGEIVNITAVNSDSNLTHTQLQGRIIDPTTEVGL